MKSGIVPGLIEKFSVGGKLYGIPWNNDTRFFMYNKQMLSDAGYTDPPQTWDDLAAMSKKIQANGVPFGWADSYMQAQSGGNEIVALVYSFGGEFFDANGNPVVGTDPNTKAAFDFLVKAMTVDKVVNPASLTADYQTIEDGFTSGKAAFFIQAWPGVYQAANDSSSSTIVNQIAVADSAVHANGAKQAVLTLPEAMAIPKTSKHKDAAWKYIEYMSGRDLDKKRSEAIGSLPIWTDLLSDADLVAKYPYWANFANQITFARGLPNLTWYDQFNNALMTETQAMLSGSEKVDQGLKNLQNQLEQLAADNK
jgi:multiple sugar transport system substrate-binding protein